MDAVDGRAERRSFGQSAGERLIRWSRREIDLLAKKFGTTARSRTTTDATGGMGPRE